MSKETKKFKYPGVRDAMDGNTAVVMCEREASDAAGAYPITPSTQMGEYWAEATAAGHINVSGRPLIFIEPEGEHAAAAVTAGLAMTGLRACNFSSGQGIAYMHESLYAAVGKRLTYILNMGCRAMTKATLNVHAGHDDYHCVDDTGFFQVFGKNVQETCDLNIIAHRIAELSLNPGIVAQDGFLTTHLIESLMLPERELIAEYLGKPDDIIECPTPAQRIMFGERRRRIPELWSVDNPIMAGTVQNQDSYMQSVAAQRPFFFDHIRELTEQAMDEFYALTGRRYRRLATYLTDDAEYLILGQGSLIPNAEAVADYLRKTRGIKVGVVNFTMFRPFPGDLLSHVLRGRKGVAVLERTDQPLASDLPLAREVRATLNRCIENAKAPDEKSKPYPDHATYLSNDDVPPIYSGSFGMGSRDLQPEAIIGAVENMLEGGAKKRMFYLSIDFLHDEAYTPKQEIYQQTLLDNYPHIKELAVHGSENPNLMPENSITVRFHSVGGWGAITTGKNLAMTLFDLLGYHIKANPKYGSEKKGQPTTYYLSAAPEPIRINSEYFYVDVVLSPDPNVFGHSNPLAGLKKGGVFIIQSEYEKPEDVWRQIPKRFQKIIVDNEIRVFYVDGFKIAFQEATDPDLQFRMQGIVFQGAFFKASPVMAQANLTEEKLFKAIEDQLEHKFGAKGRRIVEDNLRVVRRGFDEVKEITEKAVGAGDTEQIRKLPDVPMMMKNLPVSADVKTDIHRFWEQTGVFYATGKGGDNLADPFMAMSCIPAGTGVFRDMTTIRFNHPEWDPVACTGCGNCWTICPDSSIPGLVNPISAVFETAIKKAEENGRQVKQLRKAVRATEKKLRPKLDAAGVNANVTALLAEAVQETIEEVGGANGKREALEAEFACFMEQIGDFQFSITKPFYTVPEKDAKGSGGLLSITIDPYTCKGCMECVEVCGDAALKSVPQTPDSIAKLRKNWEFWEALPNTAPEYFRIDNLEEGIGALETILLDKKCYKSMVGGDGACLGCGEKTALHLFTAAVEALMQSAVKKRVAHIEQLITDLEEHIRLKLAASVDVADSAALEQAIQSVKDRELTLGALSSALEKDGEGKAIDPDWLRRVSQLIAKLKHLKWQYEVGTTGRGRSSLGMVNSTGCTSVWGSTFPYNPYPFPWTNHLFQDSPSMAMGIFEGHMAKMAEGFKVVREAELELKDQYDPHVHEEFFRYFNWRHFTDEEWALCPPVVAVGGDGALYDIGFQNLSRLMMSGKPVKVVAVDTQVYSNTGGQACTSGFRGQISDMAQYGKAFQGKEEIRKEIGLIAMGHRTTFVLQASVGNPAHLMEGLIKGLRSRRPALFNIYTPCMPEHGIADDVAKLQGRLAIEGRAYPVFTYDPDGGPRPADCFNLDGNPAIDDDWPVYTLKYKAEDGSDATLDVPMTFAQFAATETRFRKHYKKAPADTWNENMVEIAEFIELPEDEREGKYPYVWAVDKKNKLTRLIVSHEIVKSTEDRRNFWRMLKSLAGLDIKADEAAIAKQAKAEVAAQISATLTQLLDGGAIPVAAPAAAPGAPAAGGPNGGADLPWIDGPECTACGECITINPQIFAYNEKKQAYVKNPRGGPYKDIVKAAEKCSSRAIHPGLPLNPAEKDAGKLIKRAEKYN